MRMLLGLLLLAWAGPAKADIVDSGKLIIGGQAAFGGTVTVQGNAFSVGGSTFSVNQGSVSIGGLLKVSAAGLQWSDNFVTYTAAFTPVTPGTGQTNIAQGTSWSNSSWSGCLGSSATVTTSGGTLHVYGSGAINPNGTGYSTSLWVLVDGAFQEGYSASRPFIKGYGPTNGYAMGGSFSLLVRNLSSGTHNICIGMANSSGSGDFATKYTLGAFEIQ